MRYRRHKSDDTQRGHGRDAEYSRIALDLIAADRKGHVVASDHDAG
jgi:hypothetical protein